VLNLITNQVVSVGGGTTLSNIAFDPDTGVNGLHFSLLNGPPGLEINPTNGSISFFPSPNQGGTTNLVTILVTDSGVPPLSATESFLIVVLDYGQLNLANGAVAAGQVVCLPLTLLSTVGLTNVSFSVTVPPDRLTGLAFTAGSPAIGNSHLTMLNASNAVVSMGTAPGMTLAGTLALGNICVTALTNQTTGLAPLLLSAPAATRADGTPLGDIVAVSGQVVVVNGRTYVQVAPGPGNQIQLVLFGALGTTHIIERSSSVQGPWTPVNTVNFTTMTQSITWTNHGESAVFFRLHQQ
jgi:hypothetical protein